MTPTPTLKIYPGMMCSSAELFVVNGAVQVISNGTVKPFSEIPYSYYQVIKEAALSDPRVVEHLQQMHPRSEHKQIEQFAKCRFGGIDFQADIKDNELQDGEYWPCPLRGACMSEGVLCKAIVVNGHSLNPQQIKLIQMLTTDATNQTIASVMEIAEGTMHLLKKNLYQIFNVQTKQELALKARTINLI